MINAAVASNSPRFKFVLATFKGVINYWGPRKKTKLKLSEGIATQTDVRSRKPAPFNFQMLGCIKLCTTLTACVWEERNWSFGCESR